VRTHTIEDAYRLYFPMIRTRCSRILWDHDDANDVAQEAFIRLWRLTSRNDWEPRVVGAWIHRISVHLALDSCERADDTRARSKPCPHRSARRRPTSSSTIAPTFSGCRKEYAPKPSRPVLHRVDGLTQPEIGHVLGCSERTVRRLLAELDEHVAVLRTEVLT
jgi:RNA polymerase sigma-70 factor (ECF subfamily)